MVTKKVPTFEELERCIEIGQEYDEDAHPMHRRAMRWWLTGIGTIDQLEWMMSHHAWFVIAQSTYDEAKMIKWIQKLWNMAERLAPRGAWQGHFLWLARYIVEGRTEFARALFELTQPWSNTPMEADFYEGNMCEYGQMVSEDRSQPRTFLEFAIREGRVEESLPALADAGWTVQDGSPAAYALKHGSLDGLEVLMEHHGQRRLPLAFTDIEVQEVLEQVKTGKYRLRGYHDTKEHVNEMLGEILDGPLRAVRERKELRAALGDTDPEDAGAGRRRKGPMI